VMHRPDNQRLEHTIIHRHYYLCQKGYVFTTICLSVYDQGY